MKTFTKVTPQSNVIVYTTDFNNLVANAVSEYLLAKNEFRPDHLEVSTYRTENNEELYYLIFTDSYFAHGAQVDLSDQDHKEILDYCEKQKNWDSNKVKPRLPNCLLEFNEWSLETETISVEDLEELV